MTKNIAATIPIMLSAKIPIKRTETLDVISVNQKTPSK
jgi:hypothetical protein